MTSKTEKNKGFRQFLNVIERIGNKLPDPFMLFVTLAVIVVLLSGFISLFDVTFTQPGSDEQTSIKNLLSVEGVRFMVTSVIENFVGFAPLGIVLTMMLGVGLADKVGLLEAFMKNTILRAPKRLITYAVVFTGILGNLAADAAFVIVPPLAAMAFYSVGRHPLAGLAAGFAGVGAGFTANLIVANTDNVLSGISTEVMQTIEGAPIVTPVDNWYFMVVSALVLTAAGGLVTEKIIEPRLGQYAGGLSKSFEETTIKEKKGLRNAFLAAVGYVALLVLFIAWPESLLRNDQGGMIPSPFISGIVPIIMLFFITVGMAYGITVNKIEDSRSVARYMGEAMKDMSSFIVLIFAVSQFIAYFEWTNIGSWLAITGASLLESVNLTGITAVVLFILLTALLNLFVYSGSAQWGLEAPVFLKLFYFLDYHPAFIQAAFRVADSSTNIVTPMNPYFVIVLAFMKEYDNKAGLGTLLALMLPYSLIFLILWISLFLIFVLLGIPFGPGITVHV
ncbi:aminobenzoyl-glutamate transport protein [Lentibacillus persicus]|uniref:Aminobenzoyl-glutamate transport protein n=1 Tax=Lentibacillus persicus TaxID=640948 RepID=A0A1I1YXL4_9BACI|nr:AbgT family transporter [Lentibacillus persicus]SFE22780.1 aminobenzoyl-glutamate transport protein [Lentibacillus persicus]